MPQPSTGHALSSAPMSPEAAARETIDDLLVAAGWAIQDYRAFNPGAARGIALREVPLDSGRCDYLLLVDRIPLGVIEAKKEGTTLSTVSEQSALYGESLPDFLANLLPGTKEIPFAYESTGVETLFRDERDPDPRSRRVFAFHQPATLAAWLAEPDTLRARLTALPIAHPLPETNLRACQIEAITKLEASFADDRPRALIQMATGAGKTYTACAFN
jgi:type I restriction enzyme, R subunit